MSAKGTEGDSSPIIFQLDESKLYRHGFYTGTCSQHASLKFRWKDRNLFEQWLHTSLRGKNVIWLPLPSLATPALLLESCHANRAGLRPPHRSGPWWTS